MKRILLTLLLVAFSCQVSMAQSERDEKDHQGGYFKGDVLLTGGVSYSSVKDKNYETKNTNFNINPKIGYFVSNNILIGLNINFGQQKGEIYDYINYYPFANKATFFSGGIYGRYYFIPSHRFSVFTHLGLSYGTRKFESSYEDTKYETFSTSFAPGINYFISDSFALEASFGFISFYSSKADINNAKPTNSFDIGLDMSSIGFGLIYKF